MVTNGIYKTLTDNFIKLTEQFMIEGSRVLIPPITFQMDLEQLTAGILYLTSHRQLDDT